MMPAFNVTTLSQSMCHNMPKRLLSFNNPSICSPPSFSARLHFFFFFGTFECCNSFIFETKDVPNWLTDWSAFASSPENPGGKQQLPSNSKCEGSATHKKAFVWILENQGIVFLPTWFQRGTCRLWRSWCSLISLLDVQWNSETNPVGSQCLKTRKFQNRALLLVNSVIHLHAKWHSFALNTKSADGCRELQFMRWKHRGVLVLLRTDYWVKESNLNCLWPL